MILEQFGEEVRDLDDGDLPTWQDWLDKFANQALPEYRSRHRANMVRWRLLAERGGVWLDHDLIPLGPLPDDLAWTAAYGRRRCSCAMRFPVGHPVPAQMLKEIEGRPPGPPVKSMAVSGDWVLHRVAGPEVAFHSLPFDGAGRRNPTAALWAVHTWHSGTKARLLHLPATLRS